MEMKNSFSHKIYCAILFCGQLLAIDVSESQCCSRFDYDEKMFKKMLRIEDEFEKFRKYADELKIKEDRLEKQADDLKVKVNQLAKQVDDLKEKEAALELQRQQSHDQFMAAMDEVDTFLENTLYRSVNDSLKELELKMANFKVSAPISESAAAVAFTARNPNGKKSTYMSFAEIITNKGDGYDIKSGKFTCKVPGTYYFSAHILKVLLSTQKKAMCHICKNGVHSVLVYAGPSARKSSDNFGYYGGSNSVNLQLDEGDVVGLCSCTGKSSFDISTSFSGLLIGRE